MQYFKTSLKTRISMVYIETWEAEDQAPGISKQVTINKVSSLLHTLVVAFIKSLCTCIVHYSTAKVHTSI